MALNEIGNRNQPGKRRRDLKKQVLALLQAPDWDEALQELLDLPPRRAVNPLFSFLLHEKEEIRWKAVRAMGAVVHNQAGADMEGARIVMRRLMWSLNDESGGIGWGAPESMAEIMSLDAGLASEYAPIIVSYMNEEGNFLEYEILQRGLMWGVCRLAEARPELIRDAGRYLEPYLESRDAVVRGLAARASGLIKATGLRHKLEALLEDGSDFTIYYDNKITAVTVKDLAREALRDIETTDAEAEASE
jgi:HEAT repeat protein